MNQELLLSHNIIPRIRKRFFLSYLNEQDYPWLRFLTEEYLRFVGEPKIELQQHLSRPFSFFIPPKKKQWAISVLDRLFPTEMFSPIPPKKLREKLFETACLNPNASRQKNLLSVASFFSLTPEELERFLFCDLSQQKRIQKPEGDLSPSYLALCANSLMVQSFLTKALVVTIQFEGNARAVVRQAKLRGLICQVSSTTQETFLRLIISGPYALFRRTAFYGKALAELLPQLAWAHQFSLKAHCIVENQETILEVSSGDPIFPSKTPKQFDSKVEEKFAGDFLKEAKDWDLIREPTPIVTHINGAMIFPDFLLRNKINSNRQWLLEIIGFWMPEYLKKKLDLFQKVNLQNMILCIDSSLDCSKTLIPSNTNLIWFQKKIDVKRVIEKIEKPGQPLYFVQTI